LAQTGAIFGLLFSNLHPHEQEPHQQNPLKFHTGMLLAMLTGKEVVLPRKPVEIR